MTIEDAPDPTPDPEAPAEEQPQEDLDPYRVEENYPDSW